MKVLSAILCLFALNICAMTPEIDHLMSIKNVDQSAFNDLCAGSTIKEIKSVIESEQLVRSSESDKPELEKMSLYYTTYAITIQNVNGYNYHVADYFDGTRVVTSLDGPAAGYQVIGANGVITAESTDVTFYSDHCIHWYPKGLVRSYSYKQVLEIY